METWPLSAEFHLGEPTKLLGVCGVLTNKFLFAAEQESDATTVIPLALCCLENTLQKSEGQAPQALLYLPPILRGVFWFSLPPGRKVLIVYAHQEPKSFNGSLKTVAVEELSKQGCSVTVSDLYAMQFEPRATRSDIVGERSNFHQ